MCAIGKAVEAGVTPLMKTWVNDQVYPVLLSEYNKVMSRHPNFTFEQEKLATDPTPEQTRIRTVSNDYRKCYEAVASSSVVLILPVSFGFLHLSFLTPLSPFKSHSTANKLLRDS
jgi:hypothetical protein